MSLMRRRDFASIFGATALAWPLAGLTQERAVPTIGFVRRTDAASAAQFVEAFRKGLSERGFLEGKNVAIEFRWADGQTDRLPALLADLISRKVAVIVAAGSEALMVAKAATASIPIVFAMGDDPVKLGVVSSIGRPGGNVTGICFLNTDLTVKALDAFRELIPKLAKIGMCINPNSPGAEGQKALLLPAARALGRQIIVLNVTSASEIEPAFAKAVQQRVGGLIIGGSALFTGHRRTIVALAARHAIPAIYDNSEFVAAGGLMSYGTSVSEAYRQAGVYAARVLGGEKPADIPVQLSTKFELVINMKTAKALGVTIPESILASADEVIE